MSTPIPQAGEGLGPYPVIRPAAGALAHPAWGAIHTARIALVAAGPILVFDRPRDGPAHAFSIATGQAAKRVPTIDGQAHAADGVKRFIVEPANIAQGDVATKIQSLHIAPLKLRQNAQGGHHGRQFI